MFPSLVNCTTIDWFNNWPLEALRSVARSFCADLELGQNMHDDAGSAKMLEGVLAACVHIHQSVEAKSKRYYEELRRCVQVTFPATKASSHEMCQQLHYLSLTQLMVMVMVMLYVQLKLRLKYLINQTQHKHGC
jgi:hypothetical protein